MGRGAGCVGARPQRWQAAGRGLCGTRMLWAAVPAVVRELVACCERALMQMPHLWVARRAGRRNLEHSAGAGRGPDASSRQESELEFGAC